MIGTQTSLIPDDNNIEDLINNVNHLLESVDEDATTSTTSTTTTEVALPIVKGAKNGTLLVANIYLLAYLVFK